MSRRFFLFGLTITIALLLFNNERNVALCAPESKTIFLKLSCPSFLLSPEIVTDAKDGTLRLAHSVLLADEMGATDYHQTEELSDHIWAKKVFRIEEAQEESAELFFYGSAKDIRLSDKTLDKPERLTSTGWTRVKVPASFLRGGDNAIVLSGPGSLLIEPGRSPGRSYKSSDGGRTWSDKILGRQNHQRGEYLVRLRLGRHAPHGWAQSQVFELWPSAAGVAIPAKVFQFRALAEIQKSQPTGTSLVSWIRTGGAPSPDAKNWTEWVRFHQNHSMSEKDSGHRWAQLKFEFTTAKPQATPRLPSQFNLQLEIQKSNVPAIDQFEVKSSPAEKETCHGSVPFVYQEPSPRLELLRERYQLDKVIASGKTEMEQLLLLRHWVRNQWHTAWGSHPGAWMPPWDALMILESKDQEDCLTMCTHYACVFTQCCLALGWNARHCILDHHCVAEVFVNEHRKWVMMDAGNSKERPDCNLHFERNGLPLSALELHQAQRTGNTRDIVVCFTPASLMKQVEHLCRPVPAAAGKLPPRPDTAPLADLPKYPVCGLENYRRYAFPARNNLLDTLFPGELYNGWAEYFYDGYCWVADSPDDPKVSPEYSRHLSPDRPQDIDWSLNWTKIHLARTMQSGELQVDLETFTPNLARFEKLENGIWKTTPASFVWKPALGNNELRIRSVNQFGRPGIESHVQVHYKRRSH